MAIPTLVRMPTRMLTRVSTTTMASLATATIMPVPATTMRSRRAAWRNGRRRISAPMRRISHPRGEADLDQVEAAFIEGFLAASDPTSFLRLAGIPFEATAADGATLVLLRVETEVVADVGSVTPHLGGGSFRYDPLPASLVARRRRLRFVYFDGAGLRALGFAAVRGELTPTADGASRTFRVTARLMLNPGLHVPRTRNRQPALLWKWANL